MLKLSLNLLFWTDGFENSTRERNVKYSLKQIKNLNSYLNDKGINCEIKIYDYSPTQIIKDSIHIPYPQSSYKRSEKINNILKNCNADLFAVIDSDCFVCVQDYEKLANIILASDGNCCITFDVIDFQEEVSKKIINENHDPLDYLETATNRFPGFTGGLGAFFITNTKNLKKHGGFNLNFTTWGGEDGEIYDKILYDISVEKFKIENDVVKIFHLHHFIDRSNINYFNPEEYTKNNSLKT